MSKQAPGWIPILIGILLAAAWRQLGILTIPFIDDLLEPRIARLRWSEVELLAECVWLILPWVFTLAPAGSPRRAGLTCAVVCGILAVFKVAHFYLTLPWPGHA